MKIRRKQLVAAILVVVAIAAFVVVRQRKNTNGQEAVRTATVSRGSVSASVSGNGVLKPVTTVEVKSNVGGQVVQIAVDEGDLVQAGQLIARIDPSDTRTALEQAQAEYESALARVRQARRQSDVQPELTSTSIRQAESSLSSAQATLSQVQTALIPQKLASAKASYDQAKATYDKTEKNLARQRALLEEGFVPRSQVEAAEQEFAVAQAQLHSADKKLETVKGETDQDLKSAQARVRESRASLEAARAGRYQIDVKKEDIVQAQAQLQRARASVENAQTQLGYTSVYAPRAGVVVKKYVEEGSIVTAGRSSFSGTGSGVTIVDIADVNRMLVEVNVDETDIAQIRVSQMVDVTVDAYPDERFVGSVTKIAPQAVVEQNVTTVPVTVEIAGPSHLLKPGMNAVCEFIINRRESVLIAPNRAVKETPKGATVMVLEQGVQVERSVKTGISDDENTEIISGLREGEQVVINSVEMPSGNGGNAGNRMRRMPGPPPF